MHSNVAHKASLVELKSFLDLFHPPAENQDHSLKTLVCLLLTKMRQVLVVSPDVPVGAREKIASGSICRCCTCVLVKHFPAVTVDDILFTLR